MRGGHIRVVERASFWTGWAAMVLAVAPWMDRAAAITFSAHMVQHELLMLIGAPLMIVGRPIVPWLWAFPARLRRPVAISGFSRPARSTWVCVTTPWIAWLLHPCGRGIFRRSMKRQWRARPFMPSSTRPSSARRCFSGGASSWPIRTRRLRRVGSLCLHHDGSHGAPWCIVRFVDQTFEYLDGSAWVLGSPSLPVAWYSLPTLPRPTPARPRANPPSHGGLRGRVLRSADTPVVRSSRHADVADHPVLGDGWVAIGRRRRLTCLIPARALLHASP
jgi:hypothetical protein